MKFGRGASPAGLPNWPARREGPYSRAILGASAGAPGATASRAR